MPQVKKRTKDKGQPSCEGKQIMELDEAEGILQGIQTSRASRAERRAALETRTFARTATHIPT
jgi:hypothetical protein